LLDIIGDPHDSNSLAYWRAKDVKTRGKVIDRFCHELHDYAIKTFLKSPLFKMANKTIQTMFASAQEWYLRAD
jgi:hypothetical protein